MANELANDWVCPTIELPPHLHLARAKNGAQSTSNGVDWVCAGAIAEGFKRRLSEQMALVESSATSKLNSD
jgi:hypothetical protein